MSQKIARRKVAQYLASQLQSGADVTKLAQQTVAYLVENRQVAQLELLIRDIEAALAENYETVTIRVTSAHELDNSTRDAITAFIQAAEGARSVVIADEATDPDLIGGVVVTTPSSQFDSSIQTKLRQLTATTKE